MKVLLVGGTGTISAPAAKLAVEMGLDVTLLNRGNHPEAVPKGAALLKADCGDEEAMARLLENKSFDAVANFIVYRPQEAERDLRLFSGRCGQYLFISSASVYQKPPLNYPITEGAPLCNPYWQYARDKIACEEVFLKAHRDAGFPVTIVRPSHTYGRDSIPVAVHGRQGSWQVLKRMLDGKPVIVHGDGLTLWTFTWNEDFACGFCGLLGNPRAVGEAVHITSDEAVTWNAAYQYLGGALGVKPNLVHVPSEFLAAFEPRLLGELLGDKANCAVFDNSKIKKLVPGFCAQTRFDQGITRCASNILSRPELQKQDPAFDAWCDRVIEAHFRGLRS